MDDNLMMKFAAMYRKEIDKAEHQMKVFLEAHQESLHKETDDALRKQLHSEAIQKFNAINDAIGNILNS